MILFIILEIWQNKTIKNFKANNWTYLNVKLSDKFYLCPNFNPKIQVYSQFP